MPLQRRIPKRGFTNIFKKNYAIINVRDLGRFRPDSRVDIEGLIGSGLVKKVRDGVKLLGEGEISYALDIQVHRVSGSAREKIEAAGGKIEIL